MPQLRQDPIAGYWVAISEDRSKRPNDFIRSPAVARSAGSCAFCPGNEQLTPSEVLRFSDGEGWRVRVIPNLYPALSEDEGGVHEVIVDSPVHATSFGQLPERAAEDLLIAAQERFHAFRRNNWVQYVQLFKNNGPGSGASMEHPHSQLLALPFIPVQLRLELEGAERYFSSHARCLFCDLPSQAKAAQRIIAEDEHVIVLAPHAPRFAFETWILPRQHFSHFEMTPPATIRAVGAALHRTLRALEGLLSSPPYNFLLHTAPLHYAAMESYHWHIEILPRMGGIGGFEFGTGCYINTVTPESATARLRTRL